MPAKAGIQNIAPLVKVAEFVIKLHVKSAQGKILSKSLFSLFTELQSVNAIASDIRFSHKYHLRDVGLDAKVYHELFLDELLKVDRSYLDLEHETCYEAFIVLQKEGYITIEK